MSIHHLQWDNYGSRYCQEIAHRLPTSTADNSSTRKFGRWQWISMVSHLDGSRSEGIIGQTIDIGFIIIKQSKNISG